MRRRSACATCRLAVFPPTFPSRASKPSTNLGGISREREVLGEEQNEHGSGEILDADVIFDLRSMSTKRTGGN